MSIFSLWSTAYSLTPISIMSACALLITALIIPALFTVTVLRVVAREVPPYSNYRGTPVMLGLGMAWLFFGLVGYVWAVCIPVLPSLLQHFITVLVFPLVTVMFGVGALDDWFGQYSQSRGFRAHFATLKRFTMSTGMLKLAVLLIVATAVSIHLFTVNHERWGVDYNLVHVVSAIFVIILSAHLINLMDLRPLRAAKVYIAALMPLFFCGLVLALVATSARDTSVSSTVFNWLILLILSLLPPLVTWRFDAREQAMLGDAGANAMGAYLGALCCILLHPAYLLPLALVLLVLNILFDSVSFSALVDRSAILTRIDMWGRVDVQLRKTKSERLKTRSRHTSLSEISNQPTGGVSAQPLQKERHETR